MEQLENLKPLSDYGLDNFFLKDLLLIRKPIKFLVLRTNGNDKSIQISAQLTARIETVKAKIFQLEGIPQRSLLVPINLFKNLMFFTFLCLKKSNISRKVKFDSQKCPDCQIW